MAGGSSSVSSCSLPLELSISGGTGAPRITVDGKAVGAHAALAAGTYTVEVSNTGAKSESFLVTIYEGETYARKVTLQPVAAPKPSSDPKAEDLMAPGSLKKTR